ncbi:MAG TPA: hypothetical protein VGH56_00690 [Solirubrobacteraceae bacterium]
MRAAERVIADLTAENERLKTEAVWLNQFVRWVAGHKLIDGVYADDEHPYEEWVTPDGDEEDFNNVHDRAVELLRLLEVSARQQADGRMGTV